jgi:hypothetical protein
VDNERKCGRPLHFPIFQHFFLKKILENSKGICKKSGCGPSCSEKQNQRDFQKIKRLESRRGKDCKESIAWKAYGSRNIPDIV